MKALLKSVIKRRADITTILKLQAFREKLFSIVFFPAQALALNRRLRRVPKVRTAGSAARAVRTPVDNYWSQHTIWAKPMFSIEQSLGYVKTIDELYPLYFEYCGLYADHTGQTILDYGCGPGNDLVGWALYSNAKKIIGVDISRKALELARQRLALHGVDPAMLEFIQVSDGSHEIPLSDSSVDYVNCLGVLHHVSHPDRVLKEFKRVLRPEGVITVMVYNLDSLYMNLNIPYELQVIGGQFPGMTAMEAHAVIADGGAPIARCQTAEDFLATCRGAGLDGVFLGGVFSQPELDAWRRLGRQAISDERLPKEHREFLSALVEDDRAHPRYRGFTAGLDAVFQLHRA